MSAEISVIDVRPLVTGRGNITSVASEIRRACGELGFFYVREHGVTEELQHRLESLSRQFFAQDLETKLAIDMRKGGRAWRGYFPVGDELTSGIPDQKEGIYFGSELGDDHPRVKSGVPLHGPNLFPEIPGFRETVLEYLEALTQLGHALMEGIARSLGLEPSYFRGLTEYPTILFRIFHYPPLGREASESAWSVGEHTDYGLLTILRQDGAGGLQVKSQGRWIEATPISGTLVCNIGDMLDRMTSGRYRSTPHRVRNLGDSDRYSFPFFFDPCWDAEVKPLFPDEPWSGGRDNRWDGTSLSQLSGTYGEYLLGKVSKVFPELGRQQL